MRYGLMGSVIRGVVKAIDSRLFYFHYAPDHPVSIALADTPNKMWEANRVFKSCQLGCDLAKTDSIDKDKEEEEKAISMAGRPPAPESEVHEIQAQPNEMTTQHPGATTAITPDNNAQAWHGQQDDVYRSIPELAPQAQVTNPIWGRQDLIKAWGEHWQSTAPAQHRPVDPKEKQFLIEFAGRSPQEIDSGNVFMNGQLRAEYNRWLKKSLNSKLNSLQNWLSKSK